MVLNENKELKRIKKTVLLNKISWSTETLVEIKIVKFVRLHLFEKGRKIINLEKNLLFQEKMSFNEKFLNFSNINKILLKQKFHR